LIFWAIWIDIAVIYMYFAVVVIDAVGMMAVLGGGLYGNEEVIT